MTDQPRRASVAEIQLALDKLDQLPAEKQKTLVQRIAARMVRDALEQLLSQAVARERLASKNEETNE